MTNNNNDRLSRIEALVESNARAIQAMMEQRTTDNLRHEEIMRKHDAEIAELKSIASRLTDVQLGMARMLANIDDSQPTILRRLMAIENKIDQILEHNQE